MFRKITSKKQDDSVVQKVNQDLIVHNMPDQKRLAGNGFLEKTEISSGFQVAKPKNNFKIVGLVIIIGGFIIIGAMIYLSYTFIIKPATKNNEVAISKVNQNSVNNATNTIPVSVPSTVINISTTTLVATSSSDLNFLATSSLDNSLDLLNGSTTDQIIPLLDTDNDGLYDEEELALGLNPNLADSDLDSYPDKTELDGGYNPNGQGSLEANPALVKYYNKNFNYEILYPKSWNLKEVIIDNTVIFLALDNSIVQISVQDNPSKLDIMAWYADTFPSAALTYDRLVSKTTWDGVMGEDSLNFYLTDKKHQKIYIVSYLPIFANRLAYPNLFKALINSIVLK